jgi:signal transduction histidine kinase
MFTSNLDLFSIGLAISAFLILGFIIFFKDRESATNKLFLYFSIVGASWGIFNYLSYKVTDPFFSLLMVRFVMFFATYQASLFFLLTFVFPKKKFEVPLWVKRFYIPIMVFISLLTLSPFVFSGVVVNPGGTPQPQPAPGIVLFALTAVSSVVGGVVLLLLRIKHSKDQSRLQFVFLLTGVLIMFVLIIIFNFFFVTFLNISTFIPYSGIFILPFAVFTFYAIARHQLLNIRIVGTEVLVLLLLVVTLFQTIYSASAFELIFNIIVFIALLVVSLLMIKSVIHEQKQRDSLEELTLKLKEMDKQKNEFISVAAHELRGPLSVIKGYLSLALEGDGGKIPKNACEYLDSAFNSANRMVRLISNLLNVGRIEEGRIVYQMVYLQLSDAIKTVFDEQTQDAKNKDLNIKLDIAKDMISDVYVDKDRILEIIGNLMSNAIKYTAKGSVTLKAYNPTPHLIRVEVADTGPGMKKEEQGHLFQKFYRAKSVATAVSGTGLGLYVSRLLVEQFGGKIGCESEEGKGSTFWFELPIKKIISPDLASVPVPVVS